MTSKRSRAAFEADLRAQQSPYAVYGTPLPPLDPEVRDDGSYVPVWKQEVRDERGRKRLHGAFTGGWSAGYFNTVGSKEGWTPSTFVSSRSARHKDKDGKDGQDGGSGKRMQQQQQQRVEDFMDEEDLADAAERERLHTAQGFAGLGSTEEAYGARRAGAGGISDLFRVRGETMGVKLLRRMGWKEGQGVGPKVRRKARLGIGDSGASSKTTARRNDDDANRTYLFAPENVAMIAFVRKTDRKGIGYEGEARLASLRSSGPVSTRMADAGESSDDEEGGYGLPQWPNLSSAAKKKKPKPVRGGIGIGILNDNGSDDEDPYEIGPRISYNRVIGGDEKGRKKKKKIPPNITSSNPALGGAAPVFVPRKSALAKAGKNLRRCHDGRLPLDGFVFGTEPDTLESLINSAGKYPPPKVPEGWKPRRQQQQQQAEETATASKKEEQSSYISAADAARASKLDPKARAALLGEAQLPGKSVFDFLSPAARNRLASATGRADLPPALGEVPAGHTPLTEAARRAEQLRLVPRLDRATALAALARGASGSGPGSGSGTGPYASDDAKRTRYRQYLEWCAGSGGHGSDNNNSNSNNADIDKSAPLPPEKPPGTSTEDWLRELHEFQGCARIFRPMTGVMASRFTTGKTTITPSTNTTTAAGEEKAGSQQQPPSKPADPAEEAARHDMYGPMTRSVADFYPTRLLCKRFNVRPPAHATTADDAAPSSTRAAGSTASVYDTMGGGGAGTGFASAGLLMPPSTNLTAPTTTTAAVTLSTGAMTLDEMMSQAREQAAASSSGATGLNNTTTAGDSDAGRVNKVVGAGADAEVKPDVNEAVEGKTAQDEVLKAIFGDSSDEED